MMWVQKQDARACDPDAVPRHFLRLAFRLRLTAIAMDQDVKKKLESMA